MNKNGIVFIVLLNLLVVKSFVNVHWDLYSTSNVTT